MRRTKTLKFETDEPKEKELYDKLQRLPHGTFSKITKEMWEKRLKEGNNGTMGKT